MIWIWLLLQQVWAENTASSSMRCFPECKRWAPWQQGPHWAGRLLHGWQAPRRCPGRSCTAKEGAGHCSLLDSQPTRERRDGRLLDREDLSRGLSQVLSHELDTWQCIYILPLLTVCYYSDTYSRETWASSLNPLMSVSGNRKDESV